MNIKNENLESLVKRYVLDQLDEEEAEEFESFFLYRPDVAEMIDSAQNIQTGLAELEKEKPAESQKVSKNVFGDHEVSWISMIGRLFSGPVPSLAMLAMLVVSAPFALKGLSQGGNSGLGVELVRIDSGVERSAAISNSMSLDAGGKHAALIVRVREVEYPKYRLQVTSASDNRMLWQSDDFSYSSGSRDHLVLIPPLAAIDNVDAQLFGINEDGAEERVEFCSYTESCF